jgi:hypothetical protein
MTNNISFVDALTNTAYTANGMETNASSLSALTDLFFTIGAARNKDISELFLRAYQENPELSGRILLWARDIRGGAGERQTVRSLLVYLATIDLKLAEAILEKIPEVGRWDDVIYCFEHSIQLRPKSIELISKGLKDGNFLLGKWMPRKGVIAAKLRNALKLTPKTYRTLIVNLSKTVEQLMCSKQFDKVDYPSVPSLAQLRYRSAFTRNDGERYEDYINNVINNKVKINAEAVFPHQIVAEASKTASKMHDAQWAALPNYVKEDSTTIILPVCDVSGSMDGLPMDVSIGLGLYISERNKSSFKDVICTFSEVPTFVKLNSKETLYKRVQELSDVDWGYNTNLEAVFDLLLRKAIGTNVSKSKMPNVILIISDMEFDEAINKKTGMEMIREKYKEYGYDMPRVVFWNVSARKKINNLPVLFNEEGTALVSGFSPSILKAILSGIDFAEFTPENIMKSTILIDRYDLRL